MTKTKQNEAYSTAQQNDAKEKQSARSPIAKLLSYNRVHNISRTDGLAGGRAVAMVLYSSVRGDRLLSKYDSVSRSNATTFLLVAAAESREVN